MKKIGKAGSKIITLPLMLFIALIVASCASTGGQEKEDEASLRQSVEGFYDAFREEDYTAAVAFIPPNKKEQFWAEADRFKGKIRLSDLELREVQLKGKGGQALAILHTQFWRTESPVLRSVTFTQKWHHSQKEKVWRLDDSGFAAITEAR